MERVGGGSRRRSSRTAVEAWLCCHRPGGDGGRIMGADRADPHFSTGEGSDADGITRACVDWDARDERLAAHLPDHSWGRTAGVFERRITRRELELVVMPAGTASHSTWPGRAVPESVRSKLRQVRNHPRPARGLAVGVGETAVPPSTLHRLRPAAAARRRSSPFCVVRFTPSCAMALGCQRPRSSAGSVTPGSWHPRGDSSARRFAELSLGHGTVGLRGCGGPTKGLSDCTRSAYCPTPGVRHCGFRRASARGLDLHTFPKLTPRDRGQQQVEPVP
jgi:hypothetical protein